jgi:hypothetical protein
MPLAKLSVKYLGHHGRGLSELALDGDLDGLRLKERKPVNIFGDNMGENEEKLLLDDGDHGR